MPTAKAPYFRIINLATKETTPSAISVSRYLNALHDDRFHNAIHAETRIYTCQAWQENPNEIPHHKPRWNAEEIGNECYIGSFGWVASTPLVRRVEKELDKGCAIYLFIYNSDADLAFVEVMAPATN